MNKNTKRIFFGMLVVTLIAFLSGIAVAESEVSIKGIVNEDGQLVDDNDVVYEIAENEKGEELMEEIGEKVIVRGTITEGEGENTVTVVEFEKLE
jgi:hypothetical protein